MGSELGEPAAPAAPSRASSVRAVPIAFALIAAAHLYHLNSHPLFSNPNVTSRVYMTLAIVDHGSLQIDPYVRDVGDTQDKAEHAGHYYSDKAPGLSLWLVPFAWLLRHTLFPAPDYERIEIALRVLGLTLPVLVFWWLALRYYARIAGTRRSALAVIAAGALGSNFFVYSTNLFGHVAAAVLLFCSFLVLAKLRAGEASPAYCLGSGVLLGATFVTDYIVMLAVPVLGLYALCCMRKQPLHALAYCAGAALPLALWMWINSVSYGAPLTVGFHQSADAGFRQGYQSGFLGMHTPDLGGLAGMWLSRKRGMLFMSPFLALAPFGFARMWREPRARHDVALAIAVVAALALFASTTLDWTGGWGAGVRYLVPAVPFLLIGVAACLAPGPQRARFALALCALAFPALLLVGATAATFPFFPDAIADPLYNLALPLSARSLVGRTVFDLIGVHLGIVPWALLLSCAALALVVLLFDTLRARLLGGLAATAIAACVVALQWVSAPPLVRGDVLTAQMVLHHMGYMASAPPPGGAQPKR